MKQFYCLFLLICFTNPFCFAQNAADSIFHINKIPQEGILLDKGWKFHAGDNPEWARPDFNDKDWEPINPALDIRHIPELQNISYYWFRLTLEVDSFFLNEPIGITLTQVGASEIYLDGKLLYSLGTIDSKNNQISSHYLLQKPFVIKLSSRQTQVLAVRYAYDPKSFLIMFGNPNFCFNAVVNTAPVTFSNNQQGVRRSELYEMGMMSVSLLLTIMSFCFYFLYPSQKAYKYVGILGLLIFSWRFIGHTATEKFFDINLVSLALFISTVCVVLSNLIGLNGMYLLFGQNKSRFYYVLMFFSLFVIVSFLLLYDWATLLYSVYYMLGLFESFRASIKALRNKRPGASILIYTLLIIFLSQVAIVVLIMYNSIGGAYFFMFFQTIVFGIGWSIFVSYEFARTGLALQASVKEVEELSEEKHRLLSEQNAILEKQVEQRTTQLQNSLTELKQTQAQLIQREKMASLGELTAGIAHEIQNPLNFVNNFSEVSNELIEEMNQEIHKGNTEEVKTLVSGIKQNLEKINHHGKRADAIVKGMLQHSRSNTGTKELIDINKLAEEYLGLSYGGFRAKDKSFNAVTKTDFEENIGKINIIPQDIGRVILNVINNAFYAVDEKQKQSLNARPDEPVGQGYQPTVSVSTTKQNGKVEIKVKDNGNGIPQKVLDKIFQPFFTTKPTGQGTGLGLSLSYDIVKAHGGELKVETKEGEGSEFIIQLMAN